MKFLEHLIPPPIVLLIIALLMWLAGKWFDLEPFDSWRYFVGGGVILVALALAIAGEREFVRAKTTVNPIKIEKASSLVTGGVFQFTRNPMYLGMTVVLVGLAILIGHAWLLIGPALYVIYITQFQIKPEERVMLAKFGAAYENYKSRVRRWV